MARPKPEPENARSRHTISVAAKISAAAQMYRVHPEHKTEHIKDLSDFAERAFTDYLERKHPGLIARATEDLQRAHVLLLAAEKNPEETKAAKPSTASYPPPKVVYDRAKKRKKA